MRDGAGPRSSAGQIDPDQGSAAIAGANWLIDSRPRERIEAEAANRRRRMPVDGDWEHFPHGADVGVRGRGASKAAAFAQAARALTAVVADLASVRSERAVPIAVAAPDDALLLADWLNAVIFEMATRRMLFARFDVAIEDHRLAATAWGEDVDVGRHAPAVEPKGATYTALAVRRAPDGSWLAECVVDV
jgi:tRNA nucleotidyltransferase (CCA-adding enzyme)